MLAFELTAAQILRPEGLSDDPLFLANGAIQETGAGRQVDLSGYIVLPGIVDVHGDGFERHLAQRRGAMKQIDAGLIATEAELAANGITTAILAQFISWEGGMRGYDFAVRVFEAIKQTRPRLVTDVRPQLRFETHLLELYADLPKKLKDWAVDYIVFNDHLPHDRLEAGKLPRRLNGQALKAGRSPERHLNYIKELHALNDQVPEALATLCDQLTAQGVQMGSHDDATAKGRKIWHDRDVRIAEFPETLVAAEAAHQAGDAVLMGAPNVVRGGSHNGNLSAVDLIAMGYCDALASDYHYPSPRRAALLLVDAGVCDWNAAWGLISSGPARVLGLDDRGALTPGKRADLVILNAQNRQVAATMSGGAFSYLSGAIAERFMT